MWIRKRIDIRPRDLLFGMRACVAPHDRTRLEKELENHWLPEQTFPCLSVRSGFELLLSNVKWPEGSEILMSGMTIPDMPRIVRKNNFVPVALDIDPRQLSVTAEQIRAAITPKTKAIVIAHLFGGLCDLKPIFDVAREHKLLVIEDCAQAYIGPSYVGDERADISMFSFGAIKTNSSLCGGIFVIRHSSLMSRMKQAHERWPVQSRWTLFKRLCKYSLVKSISTYYISGTIARGLRLVGRNHDGLAVKLSRGFSGGDFFDRIRQQPSSSLLALMNRRFENFPEREIHQRTKRGHKLEKALRSTVHILGSEMDRQTYWVLPILVEDRQQLVEHLWKLGFDATSSCSMHPVDSVKDSTGAIGNASEMHNVKFLLDRIVFLPFDLSMSAAELKRLAQAVIAIQPGLVQLPASNISSDHVSTSHLLSSKN